jgi:hypothetical protein
MERRPTDDEDRESGLAEPERLATMEDVPADISESVFLIVDELLGAPVERPLLECRRVGCPSCFFSRFCGDDAEPRESL